jgi:hypothetical protein
LRAGSRQRGGQERAREGCAVGNAVSHDEYLVQGWS